MRIQDKIKKVQKDKSFFKNISYLEDMKIEDVFM